jgi:competence protein ComEC
LLSISDKTLVGFIIVFVSSALWPNLPPFALVSAACCIFFFVAYFRLSAFVAGCLLGFLWASASIHYYLDWQIDTQKFNQNVIVVGQVASIVHPSLFKANAEQSTTQSTLSSNETSARALPSVRTKFNLIVHQIGRDHQILQTKIRVSWYQPSFALSEGQTVRLFVRLKTPIGLANPEGFNYQTWLASQNIAASAYVKASPSNRLISDKSTWRQKYINRLLQSGAEYLPWILALSYGDRSLLNDKDWLLMQNTGTAHLFAISGMHLGIVFAFVFMLAKLLLYFLLIATNRQFNLLKLHLLIAVSVCAFYAYIAGLQVPVMRALIASVMTVCLFCFGLYWRPSSILLWLLCIFFVFFPFAHLGISFWFSFSAVIFIVFYIWRFPISKNQSKTSQKSLKFHSKIIYALRLQAFLCLVTMPIVLSIFGILPFSSLLANMLMIPIVTFVLVPLCLTNAALIAISVNAEWLMYLINYVFDWSLYALSLISAFGSLQLSSLSLSASQLVCVYILIFLACLPASHYRYKRLLLMASSVATLFIFDPVSFLKNKDEDSDWEINAFDVGQGSAIVVRQHSHPQSRSLIYDTGVSFAGGFSMANAVLMPHFKRHRIKDIDYLMISHFDNDHAGGAALLQQKLNIAAVMTPRDTCYASEPSQWEDITISILWPLSPQNGEENNHSCVVKLSKNGVSVLLAGDIEEQAERKILRHYKDSAILKANILIAPHHGSQTSSTSAFVAAVNPSHVVFTAGFNNRWGFPHKDVTARYQAINSVILNTGEHGRVRLTITNDQITYSRYRIDEYPRWYFLALAPKTR